MTTSSSITQIMGVLEFLVRTLDLLCKGCCSVDFLYGTYLTKQNFRYAELAISVCWRLHQGFEKEACLQ